MIDRYDFKTEDGLKMFLIERKKDFLNKYEPEDLAIIVWERGKVTAQELVDYLKATRICK